MDIGKVVIGYIECMLWAELDQSDPNTGGHPLDDNYDLDDLTVDALHESARDCMNFCEAEKEDLEAGGQDDEQIGHDFWLTRNGHGAGFWDRGLGEVGDRLTEAAHVYGSVNPYVTDDGKVDI